jgi:hypothetical protein
LRPSSSRTPKYAGQVDRGFDEVGPIAIKIARNSRGARRRLHAIWWPSASSLKLKPARDTTHSQAGIRRHFQGPSRKWETRAAVPGLSPLPQRLWLPGEACEIKAEDTALYRREKSLKSQRFLRKRSLPRSFCFRRSSHPREKVQHQLTPTCGGNRLSSRVLLGSSAHAYL